MHLSGKYLVLFLGFCLSGFTFCKHSDESIFDLNETNARDSIPFRFLALGDSYTIGEGVETSERFPAILSQRMGDLNFEIEQVKIIAKTGWITKQLKQGIIDANPDKDWSVVSLLIGVNNQYRGLPIEEYEQEFSELLDIAIALCTTGKSGVIVLSIPDYGITPFGMNRPNSGIISEQIDQFNSINRQVSDEKGVAYFDITDISRMADSDLSLLAQDQLHPSGKMYNLWIDKILDHCISIHIR